MTDKYNDVRIVGPTGAFGEVAVAQPTVLLSFDGVYGVKDETDVEVFSDTGGAITTEDTGTGREFRCRTGTSSGGYGLVRSKRAAQYRPGQGTIFRFTARFDEGVALSALRAGPVTSGNELSFGYNGADFGLLHRRNGQLEMQRLTIGAAATGAETATVTLGGTEFEVDLTSGTAAHNAFELAAASYTGYNTYQNGDTVLFERASIGAPTDDFTFTSTGDASGTFSQVIAGKAVTDTWYYQNKEPYWNVDRLDGTGVSGLTLDPQKGNVYEIDLQYLGYGSISYYVFHPRTRNKMLVHRVAYSNENTSPNLGNPTLKLGAFAASLGSTTDLSIYMGSASAFTTGPNTVLRNPISLINSKTSIGTSYTNVLSIRVRPEFAGILSLQEVILEFIDIAIEGTKPAEAVLVRNATLGGEPNWTYVEENDSVVEYDTAGTTVTIPNGSRQIMAFALSKTGAIEQDLDRLNIRVLRNETLTLAVRATSNTIDVTVSMAWKEE